MKTILFTSLVVLFGLQSFADPLVSIQVEATEDRWIHFPDGFKLRHGMEITHLLNQSLYENGSFRVELPQSNYVGIGLSSVVNDSEMKELLKKIYYTIKPEGFFIHRDEYSIKKKLTIDKFSDELNENYFAIYRTLNDYFELILKSNPFNLFYSEDMYKYCEKLNKRKETRLRLNIFKK